MKSINLTAAVLLAAFTTPALAQDEPIQVDAEAQQQIDQAVAEPDVTTSRAMTPEEAERWGIHDLIAEIEQNWIVPEQPEAKPPCDFVRRPFLGVNAKPLDLEAAKELGLKRSTGLLVTYSPGNGPAGTAGLKKGDVLTKFNDQVLINAEQFAVLVRSQAIGDTVTLHGLRDGKPIKLEAKLGEADVSPLGLGGSELEQEWRLQFSPLGPLFEMAPGIWGEPRQQRLDDPAMPEQVREMMKKMQQQNQDIDKRMQQLRQELNLDIKQLRGDIQAPQGDGTIQKQRQTATMWMWSDGKHKIRIANDNGNSQITITDREDKVLYDGPLPENGQIENLPADVQRKLDQMLHNTRIEIKPQPVEPEEKDPKQRNAPPLT